MCVIGNMKGCPLIDVVHPAFLLPNRVLPTFQGALTDGSGEAVMAWDMPERKEHYAKPYSNLLQTEKRKPVIALASQQR